ncbi:hypothetical protein [Persicobacter diffluens]|uniref:Glycosyl hydrolase n=1 Tax=Persicobacter diffluens TaxID=981 RepID=A0AAN4W233_9BACT|nr:hypothetical protein PEDI_49160 [Persicobacter diffluens]
MRVLSFFLLALLVNSACQRQAFDEKQTIHCRVDFSDQLFPWDGFGVNYVQSAQWRGYDSASREDYGGFSQLNEQQREEILELIFGEDGLKPSLLKLFLDPYHEGFELSDNDDDDPYHITEEAFDHESTTHWMRYFAQEGLRMTREQGRDLDMITTLYGPPAWMTKQKFVRGRDLDPKYKKELGEYMIAWVKFLVEKEQLPVKYLSLYNEGEMDNRWDEAGLTSGHEGHDHNLYWPKEQICDFMTFMPEMLEKHGLGHIGLTPGEAMSWETFGRMGIPQALSNDPEALENMALLTSHSFMGREASGVAMLRDIYKNRHGKYLKTWTTSFSFINMYIDFLYNMHHEIYQVKTNGIIMWAPVQVKDMWIGGEPNAGCAIWVDGDKYEVRSGYHFLKSFSRMGMAGMQVAKTYSSDKDILVTAFSQGDSDAPNAFNVLNVYEEEDKRVFIQVDDAEGKTFQVYRTSMEEDYQEMEEVQVKNGGFYYTAPQKSSTTFFEKQVVS